MAIIDVGLIEESQNRYLTYALSVVNSRALPDVRDGLKPVQRRILYAMAENLRLVPERPHRKSAAVVGEVLARYHPHGDAACYEAMVRMAQDFNFRYPLVDGQGNFGSLDGDSAAAYRYTEARLTPIAVEVLGDIGSQTVAERENFDQTTNEPVVLPTRVPNLLVNGAAGIAVGMATCIPPHNLIEVVNGLLLLLEDEEVSDTKIFSTVKGPDFPTGCTVVNTKAELKEIYTEGRGAIRMRGDFKEEKGPRGKNHIIITSIPYNIDKSTLVEKIADLIIEKKVPQLIDVRDESTSEVRIVLELAPNQKADLAMAYLYKNTPLQTNFNVNLTALVPSDNPYTGKPERLSLRKMLEHFVEFRIDVTKRKLTFEKNKLAERIHLLEGIVSIYDVIPEVIKIIRQSDGRGDAAKRLQQRFKLSEVQALFIVDLRLYQLSKTSLDEVNAELKEKSQRVAAIDKILKNTANLKKEVATDLKRVAEQYGDKRRSKVEHDYEEVVVDEEHFVQHEDVHVIISSDGWLKRVRQNNDPTTTRLREGDKLLFTAPASTKDSLALFTNLGNSYVTRVIELISTNGYGEPVQKLFSFKDGEKIVSCMHIPAEKKGQQTLFAEDTFMVATKKGFGFRLPLEQISETKKNGKRVARLGVDDELVSVRRCDRKMAFSVSKEGYAVCFLASEIPVLSGTGKGVIMQRLPKDDELVGAISVDKNDTVLVQVEKGALKEIDITGMTIGSRAKRGNKLVKRGPVASVCGLK